jgi:hypothetical protein
METETFIAPTARLALDKIRSKLGAGAVVLKVNRVPARGVARLWGGTQVEVVVKKPPMLAPDTSSHLQLIQDELARRQSDTLPEPSRVRAPGLLPLNSRAIPAPPPPPPALARRPSGPPPPPHPAATRGITSETSRLLGDTPAVTRTFTRSANDSGAPPAPRLNDPGDETRNMLLSTLEGMGLTNRYRHHLFDMLKRTEPGWKHAGVSSNIRAIGRILCDGWRPAPPLDSLGPRHLFIGPAGVGKSALLGRRLVREHLDEPETAFVCCLDGTVANSTPMLQYQCEALGIPFSREVPTTLLPAEPMIYFDTPGVDWNDPEAIGFWRKALADLGHPNVHLVLNAAYDVALLVKQIRAFSPLGFTDVSFTHLDEERNPSKLWNLVLGTNCPLRWLAAGQKIPGTLDEAEAIALLPMIAREKR